ncbi:LysR substrate-binding domain-containing protein [Nitrospirillum sp. BR 11164]|uniref:LysR family transcriptional regulator n=1 Tax=Nitrospirillum sp. BR 11164 TaxID=3104324 RepID=UPI002AFFE9C4|nr:LysR substrate-binding domain-containing protein [Nitrospirillum sp. BR 11164]MEA1652860.1 LysR substrate-binding domain-containing protein [Nitrospirillum sp. BR 11164]
MTQIIELMVFTTIVDVGSMSRAATRLRLSPAMVTMHLARLEASLDAKLLNRSTRRLELTDQGRVFLSHARAILDAVAIAEVAVREADGRPTGRVRIDAPASLGRRLVLPLVPDCREAYPGIVIDLSLGDRGTLHRPDGFDIMLRVGTVPDTTRKTVKLGIGRLLLVAAPDYLTRRGVPRTPDDLNTHDCILYSSVESPGGNRWRFIREGASTWLRPKPILTLNDGGAMTEAAIAGAGIAQILDILVAEPVAKGTLVALMPDWTSAGVPVTLSLGRDGEVPAAVKAVFDFLATRLKWDALAMPPAPASPDIASV